MKKLLLFLVMTNLLIFPIMFPRPKKKLKDVVYDCAIVCGYPAKSIGQVSPIMKSRVDKALTLYNLGKVKYLIMSGSNVKNNHKEAVVMADYALSKGVLGDDILIEESAVSTYHNMKYSADIMRQHNFKNALVVTNSWHLRKANHYARKFKLDYAMVCAKNPDFCKLKIACLHLYTNVTMYLNMFKGLY